MTRNVLPIIVMGSLVVPVLAQTTYTFNPASGSGFWRTAGNWSPPGGPPVSGDWAIILTDKTCIVDDARTTEIVTVNTGGTLTIDAGSLTIINNDDDIHDTPLLTVNGTVIIKTTLTIDKAAGNDAEPKLTVNGTVQFEKVGAVPDLWHGDQFVIDGSGTVQALGADGHAGRIIPAGNSLTVEAGVTVRGSITIITSLNSPQAELNGTFLVDNAADVMNLGTAAAPTKTRISRVATLGMGV